MLFNLPDMQILYNYMGFISVGKNHDLIKISAMTEKNTKLYVQMIQVFITNVSRISIVCFKKSVMSSLLSKNLQYPNTSL